jgi:MFS family permease
VLTAAGLILALLLIAVSLSRSAWVVGCLLVTGGICTASSPPAGSRAVIDLYPPRGRAMPLGVRQTGVPIGGLAAGIALPLIAGHGSVRAALLALAGTALLGGLLTTALPWGHLGAPQHGRPAPCASTVAVASSYCQLGRHPGRRAVRLPGFALPYLIRVVGRSSLVTAGAIAIAQTGTVIGRVGWSWLVKEGRRRLAMVTSKSVPEAYKSYRLRPGQSAAGDLSRSIAKGLTSSL